MAHLPEQSSSRVSGGRLVVRVMLLAGLFAVGSWIAWRFASAANPSSPTGTLIVRVIDAATKEPLPDVGVRVFRERGGARILALGTTDAGGVARFEGVEANTILVEALRKPPYAHTFGAAWLEGGETETVVLALPTGKTIRGRVVDHTATPLAGARVVIRDCLRDYARRAGMPASEPELVATTAADGKFEVAHLAPWPQGVTVGLRGMSARDWWSESIHVLLEDAEVSVDDHARGDAGTQDVGDVVVPAASTWAGRVVDARGDPVAGALVSTRAERQWDRDHHAPAHFAGPTWPGLAGFHLLAGESITDAAGTFVARGRPISAKLAVWTATGARQMFPAASLEPAARIDAVELRLDDAHIVAIELVDASGALIPRPRLAENLRDSDRVQLGFRGPDRDWKRVLAPDADGIYRAQLPGLVRDESRMRVDLHGYAPTVLDLPSDASRPVRVVLEPLGVLRLWVRSNARRFDPLESQFLTFEISSEDPRETRSDAAWCCGLGGSGFCFLEAQPIDIELPAREDQTFFVSLRVQEMGWAQTLGPFEPGSRVHEIVVPELEPPAREVASIQARVTDASTGRAAHSWLELESLSGARSMTIDCDGEWDAVDGATFEVPAGRWRVQLQAGGHRAPAPIDVVLEDGDEHDLGEFVLEPMPEVTLEFVGMQPEFPARITLMDERGGEVARIDPVGQRVLLVRADLPARGFAIVDETLDEVLEHEFRVPFAVHSQWRSQTIAFEYAGGDRLELRLARWRSIEIRCPYSGAIELAAPLEVHAEDPRIEGHRRHRHFTEGVPDPDARRFTDWLAPGAYVARATSLVQGPFEAHFSVPAEGDEVVRVELKPVH